MNKKEFMKNRIDNGLGSILRQNVLVMGDILEDLEMVDPNNHKEIMSIGFLNYPDKASDQMKMDFDN